MNKERKTWKDKRIDAMNRKIKRSGNKRAMAENYIEEHFNICNSQAKSKMEYKSDDEGNTAIITEERMKEKLES